MTFQQPQCGLHIALAVMGGKWKPLILYHLSQGPKRFGDLKRSIEGIAEKVLIQQLRELAAAGVLTRHDYQRVPPMVDYTMTEFGMSLAQALVPLCEWGTEHRAQVVDAVLSRSPGWDAAAFNATEFACSRSPSGRNRKADPSIPPA